MMRNVSPCTNRHPGPQPRNPCCFCGLSSVTSPLFFCSPSRDGKALLFFQMSLTGREHSRWCRRLIRITILAGDCEGDVLFFFFFFFFPAGFYSDDGGNGLDGIQTEKCRDMTEGAVVSVSVSSSHFFSSFVVFPLPFIFLSFSFCVFCLLVGWLSAFLREVCIINLTRQSGWIYIHISRVKFEAQGKMYCCY